jgi:Tfp pilus assembly protein PilF
MFRPVHGHVPPPPGAGLTKLGDPRKALLGWLVFIGVVAAVVAGGWNIGVGKYVTRLHREIAAISYIQAAQGCAHAVPVQRERALAYLHRALLLAPEQPLVTQTASELFVELRAFADAVQWLRRQKEGGPLARVTLAQSLLLTGQVGEGQTILAQVEQGLQSGRLRGTLPDPVFALLLNNIAYVNTLAGRDLPESLQMATQAVTMEPTQAAFIDSLGWVEYRLGHYEDAAFHLERAVRLSLPEETAEMYYHLGAAYAHSGRREEARLALRRSLELDPSFTEAADELRQLSEDLPHPSVV